MVVIAAERFELQAQVGSEPGSLSPAAIERIEAAIQDEMDRQGVPGLSVAVGENQKLLFNRGYGLADIENDVPATEKSIYRLASVSKPFTAVAAMQFVEQGKLDLDAPVQDYVPSFPSKRWVVTPRHLVTNTSGIRHYESHDEGYAPQESRSVYRYESIADALHIFRDDPLLHEPGEQLSYSSYGFNLLGAVIEGASGMQFVEYLQEHVF